jgi:hypothetical protein
MITQRVKKISTTQIELETTGDMKARDSLSRDI